MVFPAAGLCTFAVVRVSSGQIIRQQAAAGEGNAHGPVNKHFQAKLRRTMLTNTADFLHAALPGKNHGIRTEIIQERGGFTVQHPELGADMLCAFRRITLRHAKKAQIRQNQCIRLQILQERKVIRYKHKFLLTGKHIAGNIGLFPLTVDQADCPFQIRILKTDRPGAHAKQPACKINSIRPVEERRMNPIQIPCRGEQFRKHPLPLLFRYCSPFFCLLSRL